MNTVNEIKSLAATKGITLTKIAQYLTEHSGKNYSIDSLSKKLRADTVRYSEVKLIAEALDMELVFKDKE